MPPGSKKITRQKEIKYTQLKVYLEDLKRSRQNQNLHSQILRNMPAKKAQRRDLRKNDTDFRVAKLLEIIKVVTELRRYRIQVQEI